MSTETSLLVGANYSNHNQGKAMSNNLKIQLPAGDTLTVEIPGLTAIRIDTEGRVIAVDGISGTPVSGEPLHPEWAVRDLRDGTYGDFHRLKPADQCNDSDCAKRGEHADPAAALARGERGYVEVTCGQCGEESRTNCDDDDICCGVCDARRCPCCGKWFGGE